MKVSISSSLNTSPFGQERVIVFEAVERLFERAGIDGTFFISSGERS